MILAHPSGSPSNTTMAKRAAPHRGIDVHYGDNTSDNAGETPGLQEDGTRIYAADLRPSKTQMKQRSHDLQELGVAVVALSDERLAALDMPESLRDAILEYRRTKSFEGKRRQMQYVGKLMHNADEDALREAVAQATIGSAESALALHEAERWRAELIASDDALTRWLLQHPDTDTQQLRSLVRAARRDSVGLVPEARQPKSHRELFLFVRPMLGKTKEAGGDA